MKEQQPIIYFAMFSKMANDDITQRVNTISKENPNNVPHVNDYIWFMVNFDGLIYDNPEIMDTTVRERITMELERRQLVNKNVDITADAAYMLGKQHYDHMVKNTKCEADYAMSAIGDERGEFCLSGGIKGDPNGLQMEDFFNEGESLGLQLRTTLEEQCGSVKSWAYDRQHIAQHIGEMIFYVEEVLKKYPTLEAMIKVASESNGELC